VKKIAVLGAGSWGTALSVHLGRLDHDVCLWARDGALVAEMRASRVNGVYMPGVTCPDRLDHATGGRRCRRPRSDRVGDPFPRVPGGDPRSRQVCVGERRVR
jgi:glycerol-3-phosphate dehydrogenase (NAD(P)+)